MHRTQIYFDETEWGSLQWLASQRKTSVSDLIRKAVRKVYPSNAKSDFGKTLEGIAGLWSDRRFDTDLYIRLLRKGRRRIHADRS